jgi:hypothetical protein
MTTVTESLSKSTARGATESMRSVLGSGRWLIVVGAIVLGFALMFKWNWLVAAGIAPILLSALPCAAMCALGLCMRRMPGLSSSTHLAAADMSVDAAPTTAAPLLLTGPSDHSPNDPASADKPANVVPFTGKSCCNDPR